MLRVDRDGAVAVLTLDRPETKNALSRAALTSLVDALREAALDTTLRALILTGAGKVFASGGDLRELRDATQVGDAESFAELGAEVCASIAELPVPVIAALSGPALGGGAELALACDLRVADLQARICFKHARMGVSTAWGTVPRLVSLVGHGAAARLLYTAQEITGAEAKMMGLVDEVTDRGGAEATAMAWALDIAAGSPLAIAEMKALLHAVRAPSPQLERDERARFVTTWTSEDHRVAVDAYFARKAPSWPPRA